MHLVEGARQRVASFSVGGRVPACHDARHRRRCAPTPGWRPGRPTGAVRRRRSRGATPRVGGAYGFVGDVAVRSYPQCPSDAFPVRRIVWAASGFAAPTHCRLGRRGPSRTQCGTSGARRNDAELHPEPVRLLPHKPGPGQLSGTATAGSSSTSLRCRHHHYDRAKTVAQ